MKHYDEITTLMVTNEKKMKEEMEILDKECDERKTIVFDGLSKVLSGIVKDWSASEMYDWVSRAAGDENVSPQLLDLVCVEWCETHPNDPYAQFLAICVMLTQ